MRFFIVSGYGYWGDFLPTDLQDGDVQVGGGETAMVSVARELAKLGHEVVVFYNVAQFKQYEGVDYLPVEMFMPTVCNMEHDVLVAWDAPWAFRYRDQAKQRVLAFQLNDTQIGIYDWVIDHYFHPSQWHLDRFKGLYPEITDAKMHPYMTNGIDYTRYTEQEVERNPKRVIYSSSPDRGLHHLLRMWPKVVEEVSEAELHIFYDMDKWLETVEMMEASGLEINTGARGHTIKAYKNDPPPNVTFHGGVGQKTLAAEQLRSAVMAYPCDPVQPTEGFSMSVLEGIAAGLDVITTDVDALPELWQSAPGVTILPVPGSSDDLWVDTITEKLKNGSENEVNVSLRYSWVTIARKWEKLLCPKTHPNG